MSTTIAEQKIAVIKPNGNFQSSNTIEFHHQVKTVVTQAEHNSVLVDLEQVESMDSQALMALVYGFRSAQALNRRFGLCNLSPSIRIVLELTQLDKVFEIFDSKAAFEAAVIYNG